MKNLVALSVVALLLLAAAGPSGSSAGSAEPPPAALGGSDYFLCAAFNTLKIGGMFLGRPDAVLVGAIGAGISCGFGW